MVASADGEAMAAPAESVDMAAQVSTEEWGEPVAALMMTTIADRNSGTNRVHTMGPLPMTIDQFQPTVRLAAITRAVVTVAPTDTVAAMVREIMGVLLAEEAAVSMVPQAEEGAMVKMGDSVVPAEMLIEVAN